jgi:hypothetical protein
MSVFSSKGRSVGATFLVENDYYIPVCQRKIPPYIRVLLQDLILVRISNNTIPMMETKFVLPYYHFKDETYLCYLRIHCVPLIFYISFSYRLWVCEFETRFVKCFRVFLYDKIYSNSCLFSSKDWLTDDLAFGLLCYRTKGLYSHLSTLINTNYVWISILLVLLIFRIRLSANRLLLSVRAEKTG